MDYSERLSGLYGGYSTPKKGLLPFPYPRRCQLTFGSQRGQLEEVNEVDYPLLCRDDNCCSDYDYSTFISNQDHAMLEKQMDIPIGYRSNYIKTPAGDSNDDDNYDDIFIVEDNQVIQNTASEEISSCNVLSTTCIAVNDSVEPENSQWIPFCPVNSESSQQHQRNQYDLSLWNSPLSEEPELRFSHSLQYCKCTDTRSVEEINAQCLCHCHSNDF